LKSGNSVGQDQSFPKEAEINHMKLSHENACSEDPAQYLMYAFKPLPVKTFFLESDTSTL
jgi:hypothetical protein